MPSSGSEKCGGENSSRAGVLGRGGTVSLSVQDGLSGGGRKQGWA